MRPLYLFYLSLIFLAGCAQPKVIPTKSLECFVQVEQDLIHPKSSLFDSIFASIRSRSLVGGIALIKDELGLWIGSDGLADIEQNESMQNCHRFLIASITKMFTSVAVLKAVELGSISLSNTAADYLNQEVTKNIENIEEATIEQILNHTSGIVDYYDNASFGAARIDAENNEFTPLKMLDFARNKKAYFPAGETYEYSNTNYLLLGLILEEVYGVDLGTVYDQEIFKPLNLVSAYFNVEDPIPNGTATGYAEPEPGQIINTRWLYQDEMGTGDGGIVINIFDLYVFLNALFQGDLLAESSKSKMLQPILLTEDDSETILGHQRNGLGIEIFDTPFGGEAYGHTGGIDGYLSYAVYFPETKRYLIYFQNQASYEIGDRLEIINQLTQAMGD